MTVLDELSHSRYVSLTTYRKNGTSVATPVWHAVHGGELFLSTNPDSWKVKRIRNDARVVVTVCSARGRIAEGAPSTEGTARILDVAGTDDVRRLLARKYLTVRLTVLLLKVLRRRQRPAIGIAVSFCPPPSRRGRHGDVEHGQGA
ncbi:PPOX class F420-dependent oxidoreductase [Streptomyces phaeochromogenes]|uniref:PPOX class F420-dependent oxidoreductase n=1 Tax=Streptomyces phaeochromogenes TaxID=1923 RepID=UPI002E2B0443|nr:PPOX class F420-dependent oxidoreductase [Streptomyces phaeochromogenes]